MSKKKEQRRMKRWQQIRELTIEQKQDQKNPDAVDNTFDPKSQDIFHRRKRSRGSGFSKK